MNLPKFIITIDGYFRLGMVNQHKDLLKPGDSCLGGGYYHFDYASNRIILDRSSYDFGKLSYNERRMAIELELTTYLEEEEVDMLINQFPVPADYDGVGSNGTKFVFYM